MTKPLLERRFLTTRTRRRGGPRRDKGGHRPTRTACPCLVVVSRLGGRCAPGRQAPACPRLCPEAPQRSPGSRATAGRRVAIAQQPLTLEGRPRTLRSAHPIATREAPHTGSAETRRSYATHLIEDGWDAKFVQDQMGHDHASTTSLYTCVSSDYRVRTLRRALDATIERALSFGEETS
jgi:hypothetical protein